jgi:hypothetical protein
MTLVTKKFENKVKLFFIGNEVEQNLFHNFFNRKKNGEKKTGGSSNMKVTAIAGAGSKTKGKKAESDAQVNFNPSQSALSYKQYELINERNINEENPW